MKVAIRNNILKKLSNSKCGCRPDDKNRPDRAIVFEGHSKPLQWTPEGKPICVHCEIVGHVIRQCWKLHPDLRPQNNQAHQFNDASGN